MKTFKEHLTESTPQNIDHGTTTPASIMQGRTEWMRGKCFDLAIALNQVTKLPLYGLFDGRGDCHHAFVYDESKGSGIDARGLISLQILKLKCAGQNLKPMTTEEVEKWVGRPLDKTEINAAKRFIKKSDWLLNAINQYKN